VSNIRVRNNLTVGKILLIVLVSVAIFAVTLRVATHTSAPPTKTLPTDPTPWNVAHGGCLDNLPGIVRKIHTEKVRSPQGGLLWENVISFSVGDAAETDRDYNVVTCIVHGTNLSAVVSEGDYMFLNQGQRIAGALPNNYKY
jgi:hypothetical protein